VKAYSRSSTRTPSASANLRAVLGLAMRRSSSKSEMESADTPLRAESSRGPIPRSFRTLLSRCSRGMGDPYPAIRRAEREPSGRADNLFSAGPNAPPAPFFVRCTKLQFAVRENGANVVDVMRGELVETELDRLVEKRHDRRVTDEGEG
jgi:hypothetical protein